MAKHTHNQPAGTRMSCVSECELVFSAVSLLSFPHSLILLLNRECVVAQKPVPSYLAFFARRSSAFSPLILSFSPCKSCLNTWIAATFDQHLNCLGSFSNKERIARKERRTECLGIIFLHLLFFATSSHLSLAPFPVRLFFLPSTYFLASRRSDQPAQSLCTYTLCTVNMPQSGK